MTKKDLERIAGDFFDDWRDTFKQMNAWLDKVGLSPWDKKKVLQSVMKLYLTSGDWK